MEYAMSDFVFQLGDTVVIECSGETGEVIGQGRFIHSEDTFRVRYKSADGHAVEAWWDENAIRDA